MTLPSNSQSMNILVETALRGGPLAATILEQFATTILLEDAYEKAYKASSVIPIIPRLPPNTRNSSSRVRSFRSGFPVRRCLFATKTTTVPTGSSSYYYSVPDSTNIICQSDAQPCSDAQSSILESSASILSPDVLCDIELIPIHTSQDKNIPQRSALSMAPCASFEDLMLIYGAKLLPDESQDSYVLRITNNLFMYSHS